MQRSTRRRNSIVAAMTVLLALLAGGGTRGDEPPDYGPAHAAEALSRMPRLRCSIGLDCPIDGGAYADLRGAVAGDREAQYRLARRLDRGDGLPDDHRAATGWFGKAAEQGHVAAALELNHRRHEGTGIDADEAKIAAALSTEADKGDNDALRALADMRIYGRGGPRDAAGGLGLLRRAAGAGSAAAMQDLAALFIGGAPGIPESPKEGFRWLAEAGRHGSVAAMLDLGSLYFHYRDAALQDPVEGYRWLMRAALADDPAAQEMLSSVLADGALSGVRTVIAADPVAADMWLRLAARSPYHDNASLRLRVEAKMSSAQLDEAKKRAAAWHPQPVGEVLAMTIDPPPAAAGKRPWPPGLHGRALERFEAAGDSPDPWLRLPDFTRNEEVMAAITAIAGYCDGAGQRNCADNCRRQLDYVAPPLRPGGLPVKELARYLNQHPGESPVRAMRKEPATAEQAMHFWVLCANGVAGGP